MADLTGATTGLIPAGYPGMVYGDFSGKAPVDVFHDIILSNEQVRTPGLATEQVSTPGLADETVTL